MSLEKLYKILLSDKPSIEIKENEKELFNLIPELRLSKGFDQNNEWHIYDVYEHILHVVDGVDKNLTLRLAALFHDIGKPYTYSVDSSGVGHFYGHYKKSLEIFSLFAIKHNLDEKLTNDVKILIYYHDLNFDLNDEILNIINEIGFDIIPLLFKLKRSDLKAQSSKFHYILNKYDEQEKRISYLK